jgi:integrase
MTGRGRSGRRGAVKLDGNPKARVLSTAPEPFRRMIALELRERLRPIDVSSLRWGDVDLVRGVIRIGASSARRARLVAMTGAVCESLTGLAWVLSSNRLFINSRTGKACAGLNRREWRVMVREAWLVGVIWNDLRRNPVDGSVSGIERLNEFRRLMGDVVHIETWFP